jgi:hypothetical protein
MTGLEVTMIPVLSPETNTVKYHLSPTTTVYRFEPKGVDKPMTPHDSPFAPYGRYEFGYRHLFVVEEKALADLRDLRESQRYFDQEVVLRSEMLANLIRRCGPGTVVLVDIKFNMTVLGGDRKGALIIAVPGVNPVSLG